MRRPIPDDQEFRKSNDMPKPSRHQRARRREIAWAFLNAEKVSAMPGRSFGDAAAGHIRISLCRPDDVLKEAARRLRRFAEGFRSKAA